MTILLSVAVVLGTLQLVSASCLKNELYCSNGDCLVKCNGENCTVKSSNGDCLVKCNNGNCTVKGTENTKKKESIKKTSKCKNKKTSKKKTAKTKKKTAKTKTTKNSTDKKIIKKKTTTVETPTVKTSTTVEQTTKNTNNDVSQTINSEENQYISQVVELVNKERKSAGLSTVTLDNTLKNAAMKRAKEIVTSFSHTRPNGSSFSTVLSEYNISYRICGENIAWGQSTPQEVMNGWMNSAGHKANILNTNFSKIGVGYYKDSNGRKYWTQLFIS